MNTPANTELKNENDLVEYVIIGGGPAAICAIPNLLNSGVSGGHIVWIDPQFKVGEFGSTLSVGSSVPGNTTVESYQTVNKAIYKMIPATSPKNGHKFEIDNLQSNFVCSLKIAAAPLQHITNELRDLVHSIEGKVTDIYTTPKGLTVHVKLADGTSRTRTTKRIILATGAKPKMLKLPEIHRDVKLIDPNVAFIQSELKEYLRKNPEIKTVAVIGSSHSAALATMHLLLAGISVIQFMDKEYKYATPSVTPNGVKYTMHDNTGLKGDVAEFTKQLLENIQSEKSEFKNKLMRYIGKDRQEVNSLLEKHLFVCSHAIATIGYESSASICLNNLPLSQYHHDKTTTEFRDIRGLFGIGIAFPSEVKAISGEIENSVGVGKFWCTANNPMILEIWRKNFAVDSFNPMTATQFCSALATH